MIQVLVCTKNTKLFIQKEVPAWDQVLCYMLEGRKQVKQGVLAFQLRPKR